ncbi:MAG: rane protein [Fibrobacteres bacterium]|nr:rane protein [Fibrobacterota bacterium]
MKTPSALTALATLVLTLTPGTAEIADSVHPDFTLHELRMPAEYKTMGLAFLKDGTLVLATTDVVGGGEVPLEDANHKVFLVNAPSEDSLPAGMREISNGWEQIAGITVVDDRVYVSDRDGFYQILDNGNPADLKANRRLLLKWPDENHWNNGPFWHQWAFTPFWLNGSFYAPYSGSIRPGGWSNVDPTSKLSGAFLKWDMDGNLRAFAGGLRSPNGANFDPATGEIFATDNQGSWLPASTFMRIRQGRFYGHRQSTPDVDTAGNELGTHPANFAEGMPYESPVAWLPHGTVRSSPSQPIVMAKGPFAGDWIIGDVNNPGLVRVALDRAGDLINGAVFWFSKGTGGAAINRMAMGPDGSIIIGTLTRIGGNWPGGEKSPMYRLAPREKPSAFDFKSVRALSDGLELEFTQPVNPDSITPAHFQVESWRYIRQKEYGQGRQNDEPRPVLAAEASRDRKRVHLRFAGLPVDRVVHVAITGVPSSGGKPLWNDECWFTLNAIPARGWDADAPTRALPRQGPLAPSLLASARPGMLEVSFACGGFPGACGQGIQAALYSSSGAELASKRGPAGQALRFARPGAGPALYLLKARLVGGMPGATGNAYVTRRVFF